MSAYYTFYLATKNQNTGKFTYVAPYDRDGNPYPLLCVSRSFITIDDFTEYSEPADIDVVKYNPDCDYVRAVSVKDMETIRDKNNSGLYVGYVNQEDAQYIIRRKYFIGSKYDVQLIDPALAAEMKDRTQLFHTAFIACDDSSYYADILLKNISEIYQVNLYFIIVRE